jgi:hypothetical protein
MFVTAPALELPPDRRYLLCGSARMVAEIYF